MEVQTLQRLTDMRNTYPSNRILALQDKEIVSKMDTSTDEMIPLRIDAKTVKFFRTAEKLEQYKRSYFQNN